MIKREFLADSLSNMLWSVVLAVAACGSQSM